MRRKFLSGNPVVFVVLGSPGIRNTAKQLSKAIKYGNMFGYTYFQTHSHFTALTAEFHKASN